ncbi:MAG: YlxR family protein [Clostridia bacterium]|nr:YlxR family protein [Clostridia bacterium]
MVDKKKPARTCVACGIKKEKKDLLRIVRTLEGNIETDLTGKKNGRGAYICKSEECLNKAIKTKKLQRVFEKDINLELYESIRGVIFGK